MMLYVGFVLVLLAQRPAVGASPAPGYHPQSDTESFAAERHRSYELRVGVSAKSETLYFPRDFALIEWPLTSAAPVKRGRLFIRPQTLGWDAAESFDLQPEPQREGWRARFVLPKGRWAAALVFPGTEPAVSRIISTGVDLTLPRVALRQASRVMARFVDSRSNQPITRWKAFLKSSSGDGRTDLEEFLVQQPIGANTAALDFASVPTGSWKLTLKFDDRGTRVQSLQVPKGEGVIDLGSVPISQAGALAVTVGFPEGRPSEHLLLSVSLPPEPGNRARQGQPLASKPLDSNPVRIAEVAPGYVSLAIVDEQGREYYRQPTEVLAGQTTELTFTLVPISVSGYVSRGNAPVGDTRIEAKSEGKLFSTLSDSDGSYRLRVWSPGFFFLLAFPPGSPVPVASSLEIPEGSREFVRDISLPAGTVFGSVIDAATRTGIRDADVEYSRATQSDEGSPAVNAGVQTAGDGAFRIENLTQDALILTVSAKGYADRTVANVLPSDGGTSVTIELNRDDNAGGVVIDAAGNPIAGATVGVGLDPSRRFFMADTVSDSAGRFRFTGLGNGSYDVIGFRCGYKLGGSEIKVGDTSSSAHIVLDGPTSLTVHVEDAQRRAVSGLPLTFRIGSTPLPLEYPFRFLLGCGRSGSTDGDGDLAADYLPLGTITAFDTAGNALGSFSNDGLTPRWIIRVARSAPKR